MLRSLLPLVLLAGSFAQNLSALHGTRAAAVVVEVSSGRQLASVGETRSAHLPGSTLKPLLLKYALQQRLVSAQDRVACSGDLHIAGRNLACVHSRSIVVLDARLALSQSCNTYFADLARRLGTQLPVALRSYGIEEPAPATQDAAVLLALGLAGQPVSITTLAGAYRQLANQMDAPQDRAAHLVRAAMRDSVTGGMAHSAFTSGVDIAGKTGTTPHDGWFAGILFAHDGRASKVLVIHIPGATGDDAAALAHRILQGPR